MNNLAAMVAEIVAAYVRAHKVEQADLDRLITNIYQALANLRNDPEEKESISQPRLKPAVPIRQSITDDYIVCLEDGKKFKSLKRHLQSCYGLTPELYRSKWQLPGNYPMVAASYAEKRSKIAKKIGLGRRKRRPSR